MQNLFERRFALLFHREKRDYASRPDGREERTEVTNSHAPGVKGKTSFNVSGGEAARIGREPRTAFPKLFRIRSG